MRSEEELIRKANERVDFVELEDGYVYYSPSDSSRGALSAWELRALAKELDKRNAAWDSIIQGDTSIGPGCVQVWRWDDAPEQWKKLSTHGGDEDWLALVPKVLITDEACAELWWMRWYPAGDACRISRNTESVPEGFEIWIGAHA